MGHGKARRKKNEVREIREEEMREVKYGRKEG